MTSGNMRHWAKDVPIWGQYLDTVPKLGSFSRDEQGQTDPILVFGGVVEVRRLAVDFV
jgi:hypothetical protein